MTFTVHTPDEIQEMPDSELMDELDAMTDHEDAEVLTDEQQTYLGNLRDEMYKRVSTGGPYADYTGPEDSEDE